MSKYLIYESPKGERRRSAPVDENDERTRAVLEGKGWKVVETRDEDSTPILPLDDDADFDAPPVTEPASLTSALTREQLDALDAAGFLTVDDIRRASDAALRAVPGIGPATVRNIRASLAKP